LYPDQWSAHKGLIDTLFLDIETKEYPISSVEQILSHCVFLKSLQESQASFRGPFLAEIYIFNRFGHLNIGKVDKELVRNFCRQFSDKLVLNGQQSASFGPNLILSTLISSVCSYFEKFQSKQCCFSDLKPVLSSIIQVKPAYRAFVVKSLKENEVDRKGFMSQWSEDEGLEAIRQIRDFVKSRTTVILDKLAAAKAKSVSSELPQSLNSAVAVEAIDAEEDDDEGEFVYTPSVVAVNSATDVKSAKKKKRKKKKAATTLQVVTTDEKKEASDKEARDEYRCLVVNLLCGICKAEQIDMFCRLLLTQNHTRVASESDGFLDFAQHLELDADFKMISEKLSLYYRTKSACDGGIGGEREVQPGDELLLLSSAIHRLNFMKYSYLQMKNSNSREPETLFNPSCNKLNVSRFNLLQAVLAIDWASVNMVGVESSPFNFAPRLEMLECLRILGVGEAAFAVYNKLGVRYIQVRGFLKCFLAYINWSC
jgi:hypothetical protein